MTLVKQMFYLKLLQYANCLYFPSGFFHVMSVHVQIPAINPSSMDLAQIGSIGKTAKSTVQVINYPSSAEHIMVRLSEWVHSFYYGFILLMLSLIQCDTNDKTEKQHKIYWQSQSQNILFRLRVNQSQALRCSETGLRSLSVLKEYADPTLAVRMSFMAFNMKQNIIIQRDMTSLSTGLNSGNGRKSWSGSESSWR